MEIKDVTGISKSVKFTAFTVGVILLLFKKVVVNQNIVNRI